MLFTNRKRISDFAKVIANLPKNSAIIIREYDLPRLERLSFAKEIFKSARKRSDLKILIGKDFRMALELKADGMHFSDQGKLPIQIKNKKNFPKNFILSFACHHILSLKIAEKLQADFAFLSPIFPTKSHSDAKIFNHFNFVKIAVENKKKTYCRASLFALGGVNKENLKPLKKLDLQGFGAIDYFLNLWKSHQ